MCSPPKKNCSECLGCQCDTPCCWELGATPWSGVKWVASQGGEATQSAQIAGSDCIAPLGVDSRTINYVVDFKKGEGALPGGVEVLPEEV